MRLTFFHLCQICLATFMDQWWDEMPFAPKDLDLTSGAVRGKVIDFWGDEIEIYRGTREQKFNRGSTRLFSICLSSHQIHIL